MRDKVISMCLCINDCEWYNRVYKKGHMYKTEEDYNCYAGEYYYDMMSINSSFCILAAISYGDGPICTISRSPGR